MRAQGEARVEVSEAIRNGATTVIQVASETGISADYVRKCIRYMVEDGDLAVTGRIGNEIEFQLCEGFMGADTSHTTHSEMVFLDRIGTYSEAKRVSSSIELLKGYLRGASMRSRWGVMDRKRIMAHCEALIFQEGAPCG
jgi:hypothetical protein